SSTPSQQAPKSSVTAAVMRSTKPPGSPFPPAIHRATTQGPSAPTGRRQSTRGTRSPNSARAGPENSARFLHSKRAHGMGEFHETRTSRVENKARSNRFHSNLDATSGGRRGDLRRTRMDEAD